MPKSLSLEFKKKLKSSGSGFEAGKSVQKDKTQLSEASSPYQSKEEEKECISKSKKKKKEKKSFLFFQAERAGGKGGALRHQYTTLPSNG